MDKKKKKTFQKLVHFYYTFELFFFMIYYDFLILRSEIVQIVACDNYDGFQQLGFIFSGKFVSLF